MAENDTNPTASVDAPSARKHLRGSVLLLTGRCFALLINLAVQVITVRYLSKEDFGAFAFGVSMIALVTNLSALGLPKSLARFVPIYLERGETSTALGAVLVVVGSALGLGMASVSLVFGLVYFAGPPSWLEPEAVSLLLILIVLAPVESLDRILESLYAASGQVRSIFIRRHLLGPGAKLVAAGAVVGLGGSVWWMAILYVLAGVLGVLFYLSCWRRLSELFVRPEGDQADRGLTFPIREIFAYSLPLYTSQVGFVMRTSLIALILQWFADGVAVAEFRAVFPFARLNEVVMGSFAIMFMPVASRLFARHQHDELNELYWRSSTWILTLSFPIFVVTGLFAPWVTPWILGESYASSGWILALLTSAFFVDSTLGFNLLTLRVYAKVWHIATIETISICFCLGLCAMLVPRHGAWGAAIAVAVSTLVQNFAAQWIMWLTTGIGTMSWKYLKFYLQAAGTVALIAVVQWQLALPPVAGLLLAAIAYVVLVVHQRPVLQMDETFPELRKIPLLSRWLAPPKPSECGNLVEDSP